MFTTGRHASAPVAVTAYADDTVTIQPARQKIAALTFSGADRAYIVIDRINIDCVNAPARCIGIYEGAHHIKIRNAEVKNFSRTGVAAIEVEEEGANCEFSTLDVHHHQGPGFDLYQSNNVGVQTQIHDNAGVGILVGNVANRIYNNIIFDNLDAAIVVGSYANGTMIINNTMRGPLYNYGVGTIIRNNIVRQGRINDYGTGTTMANNITENLPSN